MLCGEKQKRGVFLKDYKYMLYYDHLNDCKTRIKAH